HHGRAVHPEIGCEPVSRLADGHGVDVGAERRGELPPEAQAFERGRHDRAAVVLREHQDGAHATPRSTRTSTTAPAAPGPSPSTIRCDACSGGDRSSTSAWPPGSPTASSASTTALRDARRPFIVGYRGRLMPSFTPTTAGSGSS